MLTTLAALVATLGITLSPGLPADAPVYLAGAPPAEHPGYLGITCHWSSLSFDLCQHADVQHFVFYDEMMHTDAEWAMVIEHEAYHWRNPWMPEAAAWRYGCFKSWVERWCGAGAFRGGTQ